MELTKCDKCAKIAENKTQGPFGSPEGWTFIEYVIRTYDKRRYHLCEECSNLLQIPVEPSQTVADALLEIIEDIVTSQIENS